MPDKTMRSGLFERISFSICQGLDAPLVGEQNQPSTTSEGMTKTLDKAAGQYQVLYALLAGCGPLRAGEALGLEIDKHISPDFRTLYIQQKAKAGDLQNH